MFKVQKAVVYINWSIYNMLNILPKSIEKESKIVQKNDCVFFAYMINWYISFLKREYCPLRFTS